MGGSRSRRFDDDSRGGIHELSALARRVLRERGVNGLCPWCGSGIRKTDRMIEDMHRLCWKAAKHYRRFGSMENVIGDLGDWDSEAWVARREAGE